MPAQSILGISENSFWTIVMIAGALIITLALYRAEKIQKKREAGRKW